jgi:hypothetical protein
VSMTGANNNRVDPPQTDEGFKQSPYRALTPV